jgi:hypothetical protein
MKSLSPEARRCLDLAADPRKQLSGGGGRGTLRLGPVELRTGQQSMTHGPID